MPEKFTLKVNTERNSKLILKSLWSSHAASPTVLPTAAVSRSSPKPTWLSSSVWLRGLLHRAETVVFARSADFWKPEASMSRGWIRLEKSHAKLPICKVRKCRMIICASLPSQLVISKAALCLSRTKSRNLQRQSKSLKISFYHQIKFRILKECSLRFAAIIWGFRIKDISLLKLSQIIPSKIEI